MLLPMYIRYLTGDLTRLNRQFQSLVSSKRTRLLSLYLRIPDNYDELAEILQEINFLHSEQIRTLKENAAVFGKGEAPVTIEEFRIAAAYCGRIEQISLTCQTFNEQVEGLPIDDEEKAFLLDWVAKEPVGITLPGQPPTS